jgi:hypothetical protein
VSLQPPDFVREPGGPDAVAEFSRFATAVGEAASHLLAELAEIHNYGTLSDIPAGDEAATNVRGLYCRRVEGWVIFYSVSKPCRITVIQAANLNPHSFSALESEAENRLRRLTP